jgi:hypothetical protein
MIFSMARAIMRRNVLITALARCVACPVRRDAENGNRHAKLTLKAPFVGRLPFVTPPPPVLKFDNSGSGQGLQTEQKSFQDQVAIRRLGGAFTKFVSRK